MKRIILHITLFISAMQIIPAHAMLVNVARSALRPALLRTGASVMPATLSKSDALCSQLNNRSLTRALATQQHEDAYEHTESQSESEENADNSGNNYYGWGNFRKATPALGLSLFGAHLWWSDSDICQTEADFEDPAKWERTKEYFNANPKRVLHVFKNTAHTYAHNAHAINLLSSLGQELLTHKAHHLISLSMLCHPHTIETYTKLLPANFISLAQDDLGQQIIRKIMKHKPEIVATVIQLVLDNFVMLGSNKGCDLIRHIMRSQPETVETFAQSTIDNFSILATSYMGIYLILTILESKPNTVTAFAQIAKDTIDTLFSRAINSKGDSYFFSVFGLLYKLMQAQAKAAALSAKPLSKSVELAALLVKPIAEHFMTVINDFMGADIIFELLRQRPENTEIFMQLITDNFSALGTNINGCNLICQIMKSQPETVTYFVQLIADNFPALATTGSGCLLIQDIMKNQPETIAFFAQLAITHVATVRTTESGRSLLYRVMLFQPDTIPTFQKLAQDCEDQKLLKMLELLKIQDALQPSTQTTQHFLAKKEHNFFKKVVMFYPTHSPEIQAFHRMIHTITTIEKEEQDAGNYTFVHACSWHIHFQQDIDAHLRSIVYDAPLQPLSLRFIAAPNEATGNKPEITRTDILAHGATDYYGYEDNKQKHMIFMNAALLTNHEGSNTLHYLANNHSTNPTELLLTKIFEHLNIEYIYRKYEQEFAELQQLHHDASRFGAGILFSFTPEMLKKTVYVCSPGGRKRTVYIDGIGATDDVRVILDTLRETPEKIDHLDFMEFVFIVTKDCALNPRVQEAEGYKIIPFNATYHAWLKPYEQKRDELMAKIKVDIKAKRAAQSEAERTAHEKKLQAIAAWFTAHNCLECNESRVQEA